MIRELHAGDAPFIMDVQTSAKDYYVLETGSPVSDPVSFQFQVKAQVFFGYFRDEQYLLGFVDVLFGYPEPQDVHIGLMVFRPEARRKGYGSRLLAAIEDTARSLEITRMVVAPLSENRPAMKFWTDRGFRLLRELPDVSYGSRIHAVHQLYKAI